MRGSATAAGMTPRTARWPVPTPQPMGALYERATPKCQTNAARANRLAVIITLSKTASSIPTDVGSGVTLCPVRTALVVPMANARRNAKMSVEKASRVLERVFRFVQKTMMPTHALIGAWCRHAPTVKHVRAANVPPHVAMNVGHSIPQSVTQTMRPSFGGADG